MKFEVVGRPEIKVDSVNPIMMPDCVAIERVDNGYILRVLTEESDGEVMEETLVYNNREELFNAIAKYI